MVFRHTRALCVCAKLVRTAAFGAAARSLLASALTLISLAAAPLLNNTAYAQQYSVIVPPQVTIWKPRGEGWFWLEGRPPLEEGEYATAEDYAAAHCASGKTACEYTVGPITPIANDKNWPWVSYTCVSRHPECPPFANGVMATGKCLVRRIGGNTLPDGSIPQDWIDVRGSNATFRVRPTVCAYSGAHPTKVLGKPACEMTSGSNPIDIGSGNKYQAELDYIGSGPDPLRFERHYNSLGAAAMGPTRSQWSHTYARAIIVAGFAPPSVYAFRADGKASIFVNNLYESQSLANLQLSQLAA